MCGVRKSTKVGKGVGKEMTHVRGDEGGQERDDPGEGWGSGKSG